LIRQRDAVHLLLAQEEVGRRDARGGGGMNEVDAGRDRATPVPSFIESCLTDAIFSHMMTTSLSPLPRHATDASRYSRPAHLR